MEKIVVTESGTDCSHIAYLYHTLNGDLPAGKVLSRLSLCFDRAILEISYSPDVEKLLKKTLLSCVSDIIGIGYKYSFLRKNIQINGLTTGEREVLLASLVAADLNEEKKYLLNKITYSRILCVDGIFRFRLRELKEKWKDIAELLPSYFTKGEFEKFVGFLLEGENKRIYIKGGEVFDERYKKQRKSGLIGPLPEFSFLREILLSGAGSIRCLTMPKREECEFLKKYYAGRVFFD